MPGVRRNHFKITSWRITQMRWILSAFTGEEAALDPGRWNHIGESMIYTSENRALAAWEIYIHLKRLVTRYQFAVIPATFPESIVETITVEDYPHGWDSKRPRSNVQDFGSCWLHDRRSCVLKVPSMTIREQFNYLINPLHKDFRRVVVGEAIPFSFDPRLKNL